MTDLCDNVETEVIDFLFNNVAVRSPSADVYVSLHTSDPGESPDGTTEFDASTLSYERVQTATGADWTITGGQASNANQVSFPKATEDWGTATHFVMWDGATDTDNPLYSSELEDSNGDVTTKTINLDDTLTFEAGELTASLD